MGDFQQSGQITTIHRLPGRSLEELEGLMAGYTANRPVALLLPALASEMDTPAFPEIVEKLASVSYLREVLLVLGRADQEEFERARRFMEKLPVKTTVIWPGSENLSGLCKSIRATIDVGPPGKGRDVWIALGYLYNDKSLHALGLHDADIVNYTREIPLRLLMPLTHPEMDFSFCKGFYARISNSEMHGRATRLLVAPLINLLKEDGRTHAVNVISAMRYALAGEFAMTTELARKLPVPRDWGLEVGILSAVSDEVEPESICQADLCDNYQHKHQALSREDMSKGLSKMAVEITETLLRDVRSDSQVSDLPERYVKKALDMIPMYRADALANGLTYREDKEIEAINTFTDAVRIASERFNVIQGLAPLPSWNEAEKMVPGLAVRLREAVLKDNS